MKMKGVSRIRADITKDLEFLEGERAFTLDVK